MLRYETWLQGGGPAVRPDAVYPGEPLVVHWPEQWPTLFRVGILLLSDLICLLVSGAAGYLLWANLVLKQPVSEYLELAPLAFLFPVAYATAGLYPGFDLGAVETLRRLVHYTNLSFLAVAAASFVFKSDPGYSRMTLAITWLTALLAVPLVRFITLSMVSQLRWWKEPTVIFGRLSEVGLVIRSLRSAFSLGYRVVGVVSLDHRTAAKSIEGIPVLGGIEVAAQLSRQGVATALVWDNHENPKRSPLAVSGRLRASNQHHLPSGV